MVDTMTQADVDAQSRSRDHRTLAASHQAAADRLRRLNAEVDMAELALSAAQDAFDAEYTHTVAIRAALIRLGWTPPKDDEHSISAPLTPPELSESERGTS